MKSALEIAMEKTAKMQEGGSLTDEQRDKIGSLEKEYKAKIAEREIMAESKIKTIAMQEEGRAFSEHVTQLREHLAQEKAQLEEEKAAKIKAVREGKA